MKRKRIMKSLLVLILGISFLCNPYLVQAKTLPASVTVSTQKELDKALNDKEISSITIRTDKKVKLVIPAKKSAGSKKLTVNAPKATIENKATFQQINLTGNGAASFLENGKNNIIIETAGKTAITVGKSGNVKRLEIKGAQGNIKVLKGGKAAKLIAAKKNAKIKLNVDGSLTELSVTKKSEITVTGSAKNIGLRVEAEASRITSSVSLKAVLTKSSALILKKGAENTKIEITSPKLDAAVTNQTAKEIAVLLEGKEIPVKPGSAVASVRKENERLEAERKEAEKEEAEKKDKEKTKLPDSNPLPSDNGSGNGTGNGNGNGNGDGNGNVDPSYHLIWSDEFTGDNLKDENWVRELREPGWTNNELQRYTASSENIYVENGALVLKASKTVSGGALEYTSGKVTTKDRMAYKYGRVEVRAKVPKGQGLWPAAWMMPADESFYGQWPKCGEIDIMEVLGHQPEKAYGTIHYGNPHEEQQGTYLLKNGTFADDFHVYALEWEPSEMRFYIDGTLYHRVNDWFTKTEGDDEITFPAPFDQPFILQMNLAVGGNWPGSPDETTDFDNARLEVDYVRVYQKDSYNENVAKPVKPPIVLRDPDGTGNYVNNGNFQVQESLTDQLNWELLTAMGGAAQGLISGNAVRITSENMGTVNYSIQLVQPGMPIKRGGTYRLTFDAIAEEARTMLVTISAPNKGWKRYLADTQVAMGTTRNSYSYEFFVSDEDDANGRLEFNLGYQGSTAAVEISNVRLEKINQIEIIDDTSKTVSSDGNYIYNGKFQAGENRMKYWETEVLEPGSNVTVTNLNGVRELKIFVPDGASSLEAVKVKQTELGIGTNTTYKLSFHGYGTEDKTIKVRISGEEFDVPITTGYIHYEFAFKTGNTLSGKDLEFLLGASGTTYLDNIRLAEDRSVLNGDFNQGLTSWEVYVDGTISSQVSYGVTEEAGDRAAAINIRNTGDQEYKIQLMQRNIKLENGKWYKLTLDGKSTLPRKLKFALQRDGSSDNNWTAYGVKDVELGSSYGTYELVFQMTQTTDVKTILSISMGAVDGRVITDEHTICIDRVVLEETEEPTAEPGAELIKNGGFSEGASNWTAAITSPGEATAEFGDHKASFQISAVGDQDWNIQLKQSGLLLESGKTYKVKTTFLSNVARTVKIAFLTSSYDWYGGNDVALEADVEKSEEFTIMVTKPTSAIDFIISMGKIAAEDTLPGVIHISNISVMEAE